MFMSTRRRIFLVEDSPLDADFIRKAIETPGTEFITASTVKEALDFVYLRDKFSTENHDDIAACILDMHLGEDSGIEVLEELKKVPAFRSVPLIVLSGSRDEYHISRSHELGISAYIVKPVLGEKLTASMRQAWSKIFPMH
jgi:DNA-binding response OmpR family regulator